MPMAISNPIGAKIFGHLAKQQLALRRPPGACHARGSVDHHRPI
jgi:hypothetical protein